jgi:hypothetical protein
LAVALAKRYSVDVIYLGKHKGDETKHHKHSIFGGNLPGIPGEQTTEWKKEKKIQMLLPSQLFILFLGLQKGFAKYVEEHAKCNVVTTK